jgi:ABC-2 type transport system ATP-binding protein
MRSTVAFAVGMTLLVAAPASAATDPLAALKSSCASRTSTDAKRPVGYRLCAAKLASFDGTGLDATLTLPPRGATRGRLPLLVFLHGLLSDKGEYLSATRAGTGADRKDAAYKTIRFNNVWFASRGYAVLNYTARGHGASGGSIELASRKVEVRDTQYLTGLLVDDPQLGVNRGRVGVVGSSYGGGQAWLLLTTRGAGAPEYGSWRSPAGRLVKLAAVVPTYTWTDLLYSLVPNGRQRTDRIVDSKTANRPLGIGKQTLLDGFVLTSQGKLPQRTLGWLARLNAGEPYAESDPIVAESRRELTEERSAYFQDGFFDALRAGTQRRIPVLAGQGWTDPIFAPIEAVRMYRRLRSVSPGYPIGLYFGDFEHLTALVKLRDLSTLHDLATRLLDRVLRKRGPAPSYDVRSAQSSCDKARFGPVVRAADWDALAPGRTALKLAGPKTTVSPLSDPRASALDPVLVSLQKGRGCLTAAAGSPPGAASWPLDVPAGTTTIGAPLLKLRVTSLAPDLELNARLWDVGPDGARTLVTRGAYRVVSPKPAGEDVEYELWGNHWRVEPGHRLELEVVQDDSTYLRRDNFAGSATIEGGELVLPTRG